jgi:hypothetical protein
MVQPWACPGSGGDESRSFVKDVCLEEGGHWQIDRGSEKRHLPEEEPRLLLYVSFIWQIRVLLGTNNGYQGTSGQHEGPNEKVEHNQIIRLFTTMALAELSSACLNARRLSQGNQSNIWRYKPKKESVGAEIWWLNALQ